MAKEKMFNIGDLIRDFVFGMEDGLVSNLGLVLGVHFGGAGNFAVILAVAISDKKAQQATINKILSDISNYQQYVIETLRKKGLI